LQNTGSSRELRPLRVQCGVFRVCFARKSHRQGQRKLKAEFEPNVKALSGDANGVARSVMRIINFEVQQGSASVVQEFGFYAPESKFSNALISLA
jgi:hypothetical protein